MPRLGSYLPVSSKELPQDSSRTSSTDFDERRNAQHSSRPRNNKLAIVGALGIAALLAFLVSTVCSWRAQLIQLQQQAHTQNYYTWGAVMPDMPQYGCGNSSAEAMAEGCIFDTMSFAWVRPACYDPDVTANFFVENPWVRYYEDDRGMVEANQTKLRRGEYPELMITWRYHLTHCMWMWQKMHRAMMKNRPLDSYAASMDHTHHCTKGVMLDEDWLNGTTPIDEINTPIYTKYTSCPEP